MAALRSRCGHYILPWFLLSFFFPSRNLSRRRLDVYHTSTHDVDFVRIQARWKCRAQKSPKIRHLGTIPQLCRAICSQLRHISTIGKNLLNSNGSPRCPHNMVNIGLLAAEICWRVWGTPAHFNGFLISITVRDSSRGRQPNFAALNRGRHLYSAGLRAAITLGIGPHSSWLKPSLQVALIT